MSAKHHGSTFFLGRFARVSIGLLITIPFLLHAANFTNIALIDALERLAYDARLRLTLPNTVDERIVIVDVDEKSLAAEGRFPWPRDRLAMLVDQLFDAYGVSILGFDMVFAEADENKILDELEVMVAEDPANPLGEKIRAAFPRRDDRFAKSLEGRPVVLGYYFSHNVNEQRTMGALPDPVLPAELAEMLEISAPVTYGYGANLEVLQNAAAGGGYFDNRLSGDDGVFRRAPTIQSYEGGIYESLALAIAQVSLGQNLTFGENREHIYIGDHDLPVDESLAVLIPFRGKQGSFPYVSATDVLRGEVSDPEVLRGKIVLVGTTAPGLFDMRNTPVQKTYPGVEVHANIISGILDQRFLSRPAYTMAAELIVLTVIGLVLAFAMPALGALPSMLLTLFLLVSVSAVNLYLWQVNNAVFPIAGSVLLIMLVYLFNASLGFFMESSNKRALTKRFGQYVPPELVKEMARDPQSYSLESQRKEMTVLFTDVRGFTDVSEGLQPEELSRLMNEILTSITRAIHRHRGTIDKYMGDAVMAFWGAPVDDPEHAQHAVEAAIEIQREVEQLRRRGQRRGLPDIRVGVGVNTGVMNVGDMGSEFRIAYTVMGDAVNVASRLEGLTKFFGVEIAVSESTREKAPGFVYREVAGVKVKGRSKAVTVFEPHPTQIDTGSGLAAEIERHHRALSLFKAREWQSAKMEFEELSKSRPDYGLYRLYLQQIEDFQKDPPDADWDGVFTLESK